MTRADRIEQRRAGLIAKGWRIAEQPGQCANCSRCYGPGVVIREAGHARFIAECCPAAGSPAQIADNGHGQLLAFVRFLTGRGLVLCREIQSGAFVPTAEDPAHLVDLFTDAPLKGDHAPCPPGRW